MSTTDAMLALRMLTHKYSVQYVYDTAGGTVELYEGVWGDREDGIQDQS